MLPGAAGAFDVLSPMWTCLLALFLCTLFPDLASEHDITPVLLWEHPPHCVWTHESMHANQPLRDKAVKQQWATVQCYLCPPGVYGCSASLAPSQNCLTRISCLCCVVVWRLVTDTPASRDVWTKNPGVFRSFRWKKKGLVVFQVNIITKVKLYLSH